MLCSLSKSGSSMLSSLSIFDLNSVKTFNDNALIQNFDQNSSLIEYLKESPLLRKRSMLKMEESEVTSPDIKFVNTLRTKREGDIDIPNVMQKMGRDSIKWLKF